MEKKKIKNILLALALTPFFALSATGCTLKNSLSAEEQAEAYSMIRSHLINDNFLTQSGSNAVRMNASTVYTTNTDWSNSGIPENRIEDAVYELDVAEINFVEEFNSNMEYGYSYTNNTGYYVNKTEYAVKDENNNILDSEPLTIDKMDFVKKNNHEYLKYVYNHNDDMEYDKEIYRVDEHYAVNTYLDDAIFDIKEGIYPLEKHIEENTTLDDFKDDLETLGKDIISYIGDISFGDDFEETEATTNVEIKLTNGRYSITTNFVVEDFVLDGVLVDLFSKSTIKFKNNSIENIDYSFGIAYNMNYNCNEFLSSIMPEVSFTEDNAVLYHISFETTISLDFKNSFNNDIINQDVSDYTGTGENNEILNNSISINFIYVDFEDYKSVYYGTLKYNDPLILTNNSASIFSSEHVTKSYFWDKDCTKPVQNTDTVPSHNTEIYVKLTLDDGYAAIVTRYCHISDNSLHNASYEVDNISSENYVYDIPTNPDNLYVDINGTLVSNYADGISITESGCYTITIYVNY